MTAFATFILVICSLSGFSQNLVRNSSFEEQIACPVTTEIITWDNLVFSEYPPMSWVNPAYTTPDYFSECAAGSVGIPKNHAGYQFAKTGKSYIGIVPLSTTNNLVVDGSEFLQTRLISPLIKGATYRISFWISLGDSARYSSNSIGLALTSRQFVTKNQKITIKPQIEIDNVIEDTEDWVEISQIWVADSVVEWLTIGCFRKTTEVVYHARPLSYNGNLAYSYYYIDDVSVELLSLPMELPNIFTPNADGINDNWPGAILQHVPTIQIYDRWGRQVYTGSSSWDGSINGAEAPEGVYFYILNLPGKERRSGTVTLLR